MTKKACKVEEAGQVSRYLLNALEYGRVGEKRDLSIDWDERFEKQWLTIPMYNTARMTVVTATRDCFSARFHFPRRYALRFCEHTMHACSCTKFCSHFHVT